MQATDTRPEPDISADQGALEGSTLDLSLIEKFCLYVCCAALVIMIGVVAVDIVTRGMFRFSYELAEEISGYMLVTITFFALAVGQAKDSFHRVEFFTDALSPRAREIARLVFDIVILGFAILLVWELGNFAFSNFKTGYTAPTRLATPLWIPQSAMVFGAITFTISVLRSIGRRARAIRTLKSGA